MENIEKINFFGLSLEDLKEILKKYGKEKFRAQQLYQWVYQRGVYDFEQVTDLSKTFRNELPAIFTFDLPPIVHH